MAFFSDGASSYMSLSLDPAAARRAYVFKLTQRQIVLASRTLPFCLAASTIALFLIAAIGVLGELHFPGGWPNKPLQRDILILLAATGAVVAFSEVGFFLWVRFSPSSLLSEQERKRLRHMALYRRLSWMAYATFLLCLLSPCLGLLVLPDDGAGPGWRIATSGFLTYFYVAQVGLITGLLVVLLVRRILRILSWKGPTTRAS